VYLEPGYVPGGGPRTVLRGPSEDIHGTFATTPAGWDVQVINDTYVTIEKL
jgi:hypothetical protein